MYLSLVMISLAIFISQNPMSQRSLCLSVYLLMVVGILPRRYRRAGWEKTILAASGGNHCLNTACHVSKGSSQGCQPVTSVSMQVVDVDLGSACGSVPTPNNTGVLCPPLCASDNSVSSRSHQNSVGSGTNPSTSYSSFIVDPVLFFVKAFRLKRDKESLEKRL